jgi:hypothetical protein
MMEETKIAVAVGKRHYRSDEPKVCSAGKTLQK